ncbi:hypothetical protein Pcinc_037881 [Petrolisthes cinctipes]|uniref:Uncharacterized protein n=1 Tax=Petrolisthes cinctipes TaxID=88211 RepID=A0AAE1BRP4_PETCI|nr:hypothetical protein Pcinc_037881 [Petrolisthes cinctipes]
MAESEEAAWIQQQQQQQQQQTTTEEEAVWIQQQTQHQQHQQQEVVGNEAVWILQHQEQQQHQQIGDDSTWLQPQQQQQQQQQHILEEVTHSASTHDPLFQTHTHTHTHAYQQLKIEEEESALSGTSSLGSENHLPLLQAACEDAQFLPTLKQEEVNNDEWSGFSDTDDDDDDLAGEGGGSEDDDPTTTTTTTTTSTTHIQIKQESIPSNILQDRIKDVVVKEEKSSFSLYSGMSDIINESVRGGGSDSSPSSVSGSVPSLSPTKNPTTNASPSMSSITSSLGGYNKATTGVGAGSGGVGSGGVGSVGGSGGGGLLVHHPVTPKKRVVTKENTDHLSDELNLGYRILVELMSDYHKGSNTPFMEPMELDPEKNKDYLEVVEKPVWLKKIKEELLAGKYQTVTEVIGDLRTMLENAYRYYGPNNATTKKGLRLEHMMEQKIALLPKEVRELCSLERTSGQPPEDITQKHRNKSAKISVNGDNFFSYVLHRVRGCRVQREKELKKRRMEAMRQAKRDREQEVIEWEKNLLKEPIGSQMRGMWELPQIGHFIFLTLKTLNIYEVPQYELERTLLMPRASRTLAMLLTSLLSSPQQRLKLSEKPYMPYKVWARKLAHKTLLWYRCYHRESRNSQRVFDQMGIEPQFWLVCGQTNPFDRQLFHEMTYHQRVWLLKTLCDFLLHNHKTVQEVICDHTEADQREYHLGQDRHGSDYLHFPQFCGQDLRIYRRARVPSPEVTPLEDEVVEGSILPPEKVKEHRKMMKKFRHKYEEEAEWEGSRGKKRKRRKGRGRSRVVDPEEEVGLSSRSRPGHLRQRPRARYNDQLDDLGLSSDDEPIRPRGRRTWAAELSEESEPEAEGDKADAASTPADPPGTPAAPEGVEEETEITNSPAPQQQEVLTRAQQKNPRTRRGGKKKPTCELCGKAFQNIAALKGHRAVHTKEKQRLALNGDDIPAKNKRLELGDNSRETSEERTYNGADRLSDSVVQNGECGPKNKEDLIIKDSSDDKVCDLKNESLMNGKIKAETDLEKRVMENGNNKDESDTTGVEIKTEIKEEVIEEMDINHKELSDGKQLKQEQVKKESNPKNLSQDSPSCNGFTDQEKNSESKSSESSKTKEKSPTPPKVLPPIYDPSPYLPCLKEFELVVTSVEQLRELIKKFGDLPEGAGGGGDKNGGGEEEEGNSGKKSKEDNKKRPSSEVKLHYALCNLLNELSPWETKLLSATKKLRTKLRHECNDFEKRDPSYMDPAEEAWMSDPEPEPEPPQPPQQDSSSSSSSSEESLDEEGNPKRKLRKRRAKQQATTHLMENTPPPVEPPPVTTHTNADGYAVSSRGRIRKVKKIVNYDGLDFEKLAMQASQEAEMERARKKRKREEEEKEKEEQEADEVPGNTTTTTTTTTPSPLPSGVRRYLLSQTGRVMGYIDNEGHVHSGSAVKDTKTDKGRVDISSVRNLAGQLVTNAKKESPQPLTKTGVLFPKKTFQNSTFKPGVPTVVVAAIDNHGSPVYVRVVGEQAMQLVKYMRPSAKGPISQIKLQHHGQTYTVNTNAHMITSNIPGLPDGESSTKPSSTVVQSSVVTSKPTSTLVTTKPVSGLEGLASSNSPSVPRVAPISSVVSSVSSQNTLALAYRGMTKQTKPMTVNAPVRPQTTCVPGSTQQNDVNRLSSSTKLVTASPSVVSSVVPPTVRTPTNTGVIPPTHSLISVNQTGNRQQAPNVIASTRPQVSPVVNRTVMATGAVSTNQNTMSVQPGTSGQHQGTKQQQQVVAIQSPSAVALTGPGGQTQVHLKLESESLAQLMQRTGSKIVALPNDRGGYTLSLTPGAVTPGQKNQTLIANTAAKVQVVAGTTALLEESPQAPVVQQQQQQQPQVIHQQSHVISQGVAGVPQTTNITQQTSPAQQVGLRQVIPANISHNTTTTNVGTQVVPRIGVQQRVYNQGGRSLTTPVTGVVTSQQRGNIVTSSQTSGIVQKVNTSVGQVTQGQVVMQQRVAAVGNQTPATQQTSQGVVHQATAATYKQVVVNQPVQQVAQQVIRVAPASVMQQGQQVVRLHAVPASGAQGSGTTQKLVQIVQPSGGRQVVQMVQQVVGTQSQGSQPHQGLIYVQGGGQVLQQTKSNLSTVHHTLQGTTSVQQNQTQQLVGQQQKVQHQIVSQQPILQQHLTGQQQIVQQKQQQVTQTQQILQPQVMQQQQLVVQQQQQPVVSQHQQTIMQQQQTVVQQQQQPTVVQQQHTVVQQQQQQTTVVQQQQQQQQQIVNQQQSIQQHQQLLQQQQPVVQQQVLQQPVVQQQVVQQQALQQQPVIQQQQQQQQQPQQQPVQQQQQPVQQQQQQQQTVVQQQGRLVLVRTNQGEQMGLQLSDGRVSLLSQEQLQTVLREGTLKLNHQT